MFKFIINRLRSPRWFACASYYRDEYLVPDSQVSGHGAQPFGTDAIGAAGDSIDYDSFCTEFFEIVCGMPGQVIGIPGPFPDLPRKFRRGNCAGIDGKSDQRFHKRPYARIVDVDTGNASVFIHRRQMPRLDGRCIDEAHVDAVEPGHEPVENLTQHFGDLRKAGDFSTALQTLCIVNDGLESKNTLAFAIDLEGKAIEVHLNTVRS